MATWEELRPIDDDDYSWNATSVSNNGANLLVGVKVGRLYESDDRGDTFTETKPNGDADGEWIFGAINDSGMMIAGENSGRLYINTTGTWSEAQPSGDVDGNWFSGGISNNDDYMLALNNATGLYLYDIDGDSWSNITPSAGIPQEWANISSDGATIACSRYAGGRKLYISTNSGTSYTTVADKYCTWGSTLSSDGDNIIGGGNGARLFYTTDTGANWSEGRPLGDVDAVWRTSLINNDATVFMAFVENGRAWLSTNGSTWTETRPNGDVDLGYYNGDISDTGKTILVADYGGRLWLYTNGDEATGEISNIPLVELSLTTYAPSVSNTSEVISGTVTLSASGVETATVRLINTTDETYVDDTTTDASGDYSFTGLDKTKTYSSSVEYETGGTKYNAPSLWGLSAG